jgi:hypothetical protein
MIIIVYDHHMFIVEATDWRYNSEQETVVMLGDSFLLFS